MSTTSHVLPLPIPVLALRAVQLAMAVVVLGLTAYGLSFNFVVDALALSLFTVCNCARMKDSTDNLPGHCNIDHYHL
jgi:hypothetical protein